MNSPIPITDEIFHVGVNDRQTDLFEGIWPLPRGVCYNSYLILDDKNTLIDTVKNVAFDAFLPKLKCVLGTDRTLDYLVVNHLEPDHSGSIRLIREFFPQVQIVGNKRTAEFLEHLYGITENVRVVENGGNLDIGKHKLAFVFIPMVHWPESMVTYDATTQTLFSNDAFGGFGTLEGGIFDDEVDLAYFEDEILRYFSNIVGKYSTNVQRAFESLKGIELRIIAPSHGPVWRTNPGHILKLYDRWSRQEPEDGVVLAFASMYGNTTRMAEAVAAGVSEQKCTALRVHDVSRTHVSFVIRDAWRYKGLILGSPTYDIGLFPPMNYLVQLLERKLLKNRLLGMFGTFGWSGGAVKALKAFAEKSKLEVVEPTVESRFSPNGEDLEACTDLGRNVVKKMGVEC